jgi:hypothetical protein
MKGINVYFDSIQLLQKQVLESQKPVLEAVATLMAGTIEQDKRIFLFGTSHSHMLVEEGFYRAGGLACVVPIFSSALMLHENASLSGFLERTAGIAHFLLTPYTPQAGELIFIYSYWLVLPMIRPAIGAIGIFTMIPIWNDLWFPLIISPSTKTATITLGVQQFLGQYVSDWNAVLSSLTMAMVPILLIYIIFSRQMIRSITAGALK